MHRGTAAADQFAIQLGAPIAEEIVRAHRGEIELLSVPGKGSEVIVRIPLAGGSSVVATAKEEAAGDGR